MTETVTADVARGSFYLAVYQIASAGSRAVNAIFFGGSVHETLSARAWRESFESEKWARRRAFIDRIVFWETGHCEDAWEAEVLRARMTLEYDEWIKRDV